MTTTTSADAPQAPSPIDTQALDALINNALLGAYDLDMSAGEAFRTQLDMMIDTALNREGAIAVGIADRTAAKVYEFAAFDLGIEIARRIIADPLADHRAAMQESLAAAIKDARALVAVEGGCK